jgi:hypothetical protein
VLLEVAVHPSQVLQLSVSVSSVLSVSALAVLVQVLSAGSLSSPERF